MTAAGANKKPAKDAKKTAKPDIDKPGKSAPSATSKPVIVSNRPLLKDPMVVDENTASKTEESEKEELAHATGPKVKPLGAPIKGDDDGTENKADQAAEDKGSAPEPKTEPQEEAPAGDNSQPTESQPAAGKETQPKSDDTKAAEQVRHDADTQKLIDSGKYELPINSVEKRKTKRFVVLGVLLAILLTLAWIDIAADAGLIQINGVKPVTHFFSN